MLVAVVAVAALPDKLPVKDVAAKSPVAFVKVNRVVPLSVMMKLTAAASSSISIVLFVPS